MFLVDLPIEEKGYIIFSVYEDKKDSFRFLGSRVILCKPDIKNVQELFIQGSRIFYSGLSSSIPKNINLHRNQIYKIPTFLSCSFVEPCLFSTFIYNEQCLAYNYTPKITKSMEQISIIIEMKSTFTLNSNEFFIGIHIPYPYKFEFVEIHEK